MDSNGVGFHAAHRSHTKRTSRAEARYSDRMHSHDLSQWTHQHVFDQGNPAAERSTRAVLWITLVMMVLEIVAGWWFNSMALQADGWHMSSHAVAIGVSAFAYAAARRASKDPRFSFGTWKIEVLGGFASAIFLLGVAGMMIYASIERVISPQPIHYQQALVIAALGLAVNLACAIILGGGGSDHAHHHAHGHHHEHDGHAHVHNADLNLRSAYVHVLADAATSVLAIVALAGGWMYGWAWLDPVMGIVGAVLVSVWAKNLIQETGKVLLDREMDHPIVKEIREVVETNDDNHTQLSDLHVWRVGKRVYACAIVLVTHDQSLTADRVRAQLAQHEEIVHATIEINRCGDA